MADVRSTEPDAGQAERTLVATLRHDLRTPINAILGYGEMLLEDDEALGTAAGSLAVDLRQIVAAGTELLKLVNQALDPTRHESGEVDAANVRAMLRRDLREPIVTIIGYGEALLEKGAASGRQDVLSDLDKISEAAHRFLAVIEGASGSPATAGAWDDPQRKPDPEAESSSTTVLVHDAVAAFHSSTRGGIPEHEGRGAILIADDNELNRDVLARYLRRNGHTVTDAADGRQALDMATSRTFDLILLDILMPEVNGYEVLVQLKANAMTRDIPVIVISALDEMDAVVGCIEVGAEDYLTKPFNQTLLRARIGACLEKKWLRDQEKEYLRQVAVLTAAAAAVEERAFDPQTLEQAAGRADALGQLARVFQRMAVEVHMREQRLTQEVQQLRIEVDQAKMAAEVATISKTDFFADLERKASDLRSHRPKGD
jgi:CheY-like chemotaxis protein